MVCEIYGPVIISEDIMKTMDLDKALCSLLQSTTSALRVERAAVLILVPGVNCFQAVDFPAPKRLLNVKMTPVRRYFKEHPTPVVVELLQREINKTLITYKRIVQKVARDNHQTLAAQNPAFQLKRAAVELLVELKVAIVIPIIVDQRPIGIVLLGNKLVNGSFNQRDLNFLTRAGAQTANTIKKARYLAPSERLTPIAAIESGRLKITPKIFDLNEVVSQQLDHLQVKATEANLYLKGVYSKKQASVFADPKLVASAVANLIGNGLKYTKQGGVTVTVAKKPRFYEVQVTDTGVGISTANRQQLFQKMGTGWGLDTTKALIELMGGSVWVKSAVGRGSTFAFSVPQQQPVRIASPDYRRHSSF